MEAPVNSPETEQDRYRSARGLGLTVLACVGTTAIAMPLLAYLDLANIVMLFLLTVLVVAVKLGRNAAILASILSVLLFDVFFVPPRFSLAVSNIQYLVTFAVMLVTALTTTHLTSGLRQKAREAEQRERRTQALYLLARNLAGSLGSDQVLALTEAFIEEQLAARSLILLPEATGKGLLAPSSDRRQSVEMHLATVALDSGRMVRDDEIGGLGLASLYFPLHASTRVRGVLAVGFDNNPAEPTRQTISLLEAVSSLAAVALERLHYVEVAQATAVRMLTERLRSSILSALSHDLRTPLTAMVGLADALFLVKPALPPAALETAQALREQAVRLAGLVANLLDMARLNAGEVVLRHEWQPLEEVVGASLKLLAGGLADHAVKVELAPDLPLLRFDAVLVERVLCNLLENAAKYAPPHTVIRLHAERRGDFVEVTVEDRGPGFPETQREELFEMFVRGRSAAGKPGAGLGLAICKAIVDAHGGRVRADNLAGGGACVGFSLPVGNPPVVEEEMP